MAKDLSWLEEPRALDCVQECDHEDKGTVTYCGWFRGLYYRWSTSHGYVTCQEEQKDQVKDHHRNRLVVKELKEKLKGLKNVKALVEILRLPKWKTIFVRGLRLTCSCSSSSDGAKNKKKRMQFQYDPKSYALNFDDGIEKEGDDGVYLDFSARYACPLVLMLFIMLVYII